MSNLNHALIFMNKETEIEFLEKKNKTYYKGTYM